MTRAIENNPEQLFPGEDLFHFESDWRVAHVKSRREKALAQFLAKEKIGYYLPMYKRRQAAQKRARFSLMPVFSGYVFFRANDRQRYKAMRSNHIARTIDVQDPCTFLKEIEQVRIALSSGVPLHPLDHFKQGQRVRVKSGLLADLEGMILRKKKGWRLVLSVTSIMQSVSVEIDEAQVEPLN